MSEAENDLHFLELAFHPSVVTVSCHHRMSSHRVFKHHSIKLDISVCCCGMDIALVLVAAVVESDCNPVSLRESIVSQERYHRCRHAFCNMIQPDKMRGEIIVELKNVHILVTDTSPSLPALTVSACISLSRTVLDFTEMYLFALPHTTQTFSNTGLWEDCLTALVERRVFLEGGGSKLWSSLATAVAWW